MAVCVFGNPITNSTLDGMAEFAGKKDHTEKIDRAGAALKLKDSDGKKEISLQHLEKLKANLDWNLHGIATFCCVYNATGDTVKFVTHHDWAGNIIFSAYPDEIKNGQWGVFLHVTKIFTPGSVGAVVYRGKNIFDVENDWMLAWNNPLDPKSQNTAYTQIHPKGHFNNKHVWSKIHEKLINSGSTSKSEWDGCVSSVKIGNQTIPIFEGELTIKKICK